MEPLNDSLKKIARGTGVAMIGIFLGLLLGFIVKITIARHGLQANYGLFSLALVVLNLCMTLACLGLHEGIARYIAYFSARGEVVKVRETIAVSLKLTTATSLIISAVLFFSAEAIALNIFHAPDLITALRIFAIAVPFLTLVTILVAAFRGFGRVEPAAFSQPVLINVLFLMFLSISIFLDSRFITTYYAYLASLIITFTVLAIYTVRKLPQQIMFTGSKADITVRKELLIFSLPLLGTAMLSMILVWTDTLMLGYFKTPQVVGLYNAAYPLAMLISQPLAALLLVYTPIATSLYSQNLMAELRRNYAVLTKWLTLLTMPLFLVLCLFPEAVINLCFGTAYITATPALRILSIGFIVKNLFGPNGGTLLAIGDSRFMMWSVLTATIVNVLLNISLIPPLGIVGAAIASAISLTLMSIIISVRLYRLCRAQPLSKNLLKPLVASVVLALLFKAIVGSFLTITLWMLPLLFILYYAIYGTATVLTRSFDKEDIALLLEVEKRTGINAEPIKRILRRFV